MASNAQRGAHEAWDSCRNRCGGARQRPRGRSGRGRRNQGTGTYAQSFVTCWGSQVYLTGSVHYKELEPEFNVEYNHRLTGTDSVTGAEYRLNATIVAMFAGSPDGSTVEE